MSLRITIGRPANLRDSLRISKGRESHSKPLVAKGFHSAGYSRYSLSLPYTCAGARARGDEVGKGDSPE